MLSNAFLEFSQQGKNPLPGGMKEDKLRQHNLRDWTQHQQGAALEAEKGICSLANMQHQCRGDNIAKEEEGTLQNICVNQGL